MGVIGVLIALILKNITEDRGKLGREEIVYLTKDQYKVLLALHKYPLATISDLKDHINEVYNEKKTFYSVKRAFLELTEKGIIQSFAASVDPQKVGLKRVCYFFTTNSYKKTQLLQKIIDRHNYSRYSSKATSGKERGLYVEFEIPPNTEGFLEQLGEILIKKKIVSSVVNFDGDLSTIKTDIDLTYIDPSTFKWKFNIKDWINYELDNKTTNANMGSSKTAVTSLDSQIDRKINETDLWLMRVLTINPRQKNKDMLKTLNEEKLKLTKKPFNKDISTVSRRKRYILEHYIGDTQVIVDSSLFSLEVKMLYNIHINKKEVEKIKKLLIAHPIPYRTNFVETKEGFRWYIYRAPLHFVNDLTAFLWSLDPDVMQILHWLLKSKLYWFYPLNYDINTSSWITSYEHFFESFSSLLS